MSSIRLLFALSAVGLLGACSERNDATSPVIDPPPLTPALDRPVLRADGPQDVAGQPGETLSDFPRVKVVMSVSGVPVRGLAVTFTKSRGGVSRTVESDAQGVANFGQFMFGEQWSMDTVVAVADQVSPLPFTGYAKSTEVIRYDLYSTGGRLLPPASSYGGSYVLLTDGTYYLYAFKDAASDSLPSRPSGRYVRSGNTIDFYVTGSVSEFYQKLNGHFSRGFLDAHGMHVSYEDTFDFEDEEYVRR